MDNTNTNNNDEDDNTNDKTLKIFLFIWRPMPKNPGTAPSESVLRQDIYVAEELAANASNVID